jgi:hypothetical protein
VVVDGPGEGTVIDADAARDRAVRDDAGRDARRAG